jgi:tricarballylate dehydrogenase
MSYDVIVVGAGNAALCAALSASECGAKVIILEKAPMRLKGGNTRFCIDMRFPYGDVEKVCELLPNLSENTIRKLNIIPYSETDFHTDIMEVTKGQADREITKLVVQEANNTIRWLCQLGIKFIPNNYYSIRDAKAEGKFQGFHQAAFKMAGAGSGYVYRMFKFAERKGIDIRYEAESIKLLTPKRERKVEGVRILEKGRYADIKGKAVVLACGGFEANSEWRAKYLGTGWERAIVRGTRYNTGDGIRMALELGAQVSGHWSRCHATAEDFNSPKFGDEYNPVKGLKFTRASYLLGIIVNLRGERFIDEGKDVVDKTYSQVGEAIVKQQDGIAVQIFDSKVEHLLQHYYRGKGIIANSIEQLIDKLKEKVGDVEREYLIQTIADYNRSIQKGQFNPMGPDGKRTEGIRLPKSNWAQTLDTPPFLAYPVIGGITFTYGGLKIDHSARVIDTNGDPIPGLYAAGEIVGFWYHNYLGSAGLTVNAVLGKIAGAESATYAKG